jgi:uncharacterized protein (TIGR03067 family)
MRQSVLVVIGLVLSVWPQRCEAQSQDLAKPLPKPPGKDEHMEAISGRWKFISIIQSGRKLDYKPFEDNRIIIVNGMFKWVALTPTVWQTMAPEKIVIDSSATPKTFDMSDSKGPIKVIYEIDGNTLRIGASSDRNRPKSMALADNVWILEKENGFSREDLEKEIAKKVDPPKPLYWPSRKTGKNDENSK